MNLFIILFLISINGFLALSELAIVSARKSHLRDGAEKGKHGAQVALALAENPNRFLSTVQIGITLVGIGAGAFGGSTLAGQFAEVISRNIPALARYAEQFSLVVIIGITTYLSLVIGELVPKQIALANPERVAVVVARPMYLFSKIATPLVIVLSRSSDFILRFTRIERGNNHFITDFDVFALMREGLHSGEFNPSEHRMVRGALELDDTRVREIITPRTDLVWIDISDTVDQLQEKITEHIHSAYPVCSGTIDNVIGVVRTKDMLKQLISDETLNIEAIMHNPIFVPETVQALDVLNQFKNNSIHMALVVGEFGGIAGVITLNDLIEEVVGDVDMADPEAILRDDGSWLIDGQYPLDKLQTLFTGFEVPEDEVGDYHTLAGFVLTRLGHVPKATASFKWQDDTYEVVDMDGKRVDKVLISRSDAAEL